MKINGKEFTIGADPEVFLMKNGKFISAHDKLPGSKEEPFVVESGAVQVDGLAAEFNIDPAVDKEGFKNNLNKVQSILKKMVPDCEIMQECSAFFDEDFTKNIPAFNLELGCSADYNGWSMEQINTPDAKQLMRTAGGHAHIGGFYSDDEYDPIHFDDCCRLARILDENVGVYSILWDKDDNRRKMYGRAGSFRPKKYGMEYRTLSNMWIFSDKLVDFVYEGIKKSIGQMFDLNYEPNPIVQDIINNSDRGSDYFKNNKEVEKLFA